MGVINNAFNQASWSVVQLASAASKYISRRNKEGKNRAKQSYNVAATIKKQNNELTKSTVETTKPYFKAYWDIPPEKDEQKIAEQKVLEQMAQEKTKPTSFEVLEKMAEEKTKAASFGELPTVSAENSETNISAKDPEVQGLIEVKQKNALKSAAGQRSQERYQNIKEKLTYRFADEHNIDDVWRNISLDPNITDEMIRKAGYTKTKILEEWKWYNDSPSDWMDKLNSMGEEYGVGGGIAEEEEGSSFGRLLSAYIKAKAGGKTLEQQLEEYELSKAEEEPSVDDWYLNFDRNDSTMSNSDNYKVWQDDSTEEEQDETKTDRNFSGFIWQDEFTKKESTEDDSTEEKKDEVKTDRDFSGFKF